MFDSGITLWNATVRWLNFSLLVSIRLWRLFVILLLSIQILDISTSLLVITHIHLILRSFCYLLIVLNSQIRSILLTSIINIKHHLSRSRWSILVPQTVFRYTMLSSLLLCMLTPISTRSNLCLRYAWRVVGLITNGGVASTSCLVGRYRSSR